MIGGMKSYTPFCQLTYLIFAAALPLAAQHYRVAEMTSQQIRDLDRSRTVVLLPGGVLAEHGPYLPNFADGYISQHLASTVADAIVARPGWKVLEFPIIPLGAGGANEIGNKQTFPGTFAVRAATLRAIFMDLATELGTQGFRWLVVVDDHGFPVHNLMLEQASEYFMEEFGGCMISLTNLSDPQQEEKWPTLFKQHATEQQLAEDGFTVHAGMLETSHLLFLRPDLVREDYLTSPSLTGKDFRALIELASKDTWPGYFGAPRHATTALGAFFNSQSERHAVRILMKILDGEDLKRFVRYSNSASGSNSKDDPYLAEERRKRDSQLRWLKKKGIEN